MNVTEYLENRFDFEKAFNIYRSIEFDDFRFLEAGEVAVNLLILSKKKVKTIDEAILVLTFIEVLKDEDWIFENEGLYAGIDYGKKMMNESYYTTPMQKIEDFKLLDIFKNENHGSHSIYYNDEKIDLTKDDIVRNENCFHEKSQVCFELCNEWNYKEYFVEFKSDFVIYRWVASA